MKSSDPPRRGDVYWVSFDPSLGGEIKKTRPAVVVSNDIANRELNRIQVVPVTSNADRLYPSEAFIEIEGRRCKAMADQLATVSKLRLQSRIGRLKQDEIHSLEGAILVQLGFPVAVFPR